MKIIQIIHNPTAGNENHSKESLINKVLNAGHEYNYASTDDTGWEDFHHLKRDAFLVAGGDGTVRKLAVELLENPHIQRNPIVLFPLGTANNISETLGISPEVLDLDLLGSIKKFDCGMIEGLNKRSYFLEGMGFGVFPALIEEMDIKKLEFESPAEELKMTVEVLLNIVKNFKATKVKINADGIKIKGSFLLVELLNIQTIGPNLRLAPNADPGDAYFELVMIHENARDKFITYLENMMAGSMEQVDMENFIMTLRLKKVKIKGKGKVIHIDDEIVDYTGKSITAEVIPSAIEFIISG